MTHYRAVSIPSAALALLLVAALGACSSDAGGEAPSVRCVGASLCADAPSFTEERPNIDPLLSLSLTVPREPHHLADRNITVVVHWNTPGWQVDRVTAEEDAGAALALRFEQAEAEIEGGAKLILHPSEEAIGLDTLRIHATSGDEEAEVTLDARAALAPGSIHATSTLRGPGGLLWIGTPEDGAYAIVEHGDSNATAPSVISIPAIESAAPYDPSFTGLQSAGVLSLAPDAAGVWFATTTTGLTYAETTRWAEGGAGIWRHTQPELADEGTLALELQQTATTLIPTGDGLWVGTLDGLFWVEHGGDRFGAMSWIRVADGVILSLALDEQGRLWIASTRQVDLEDDGEAPIDDWVQAPTLRRLDAAGTPADPSDDSLVEAPLVSGEAPVEAALALVFEGGRLWIGTTRGVMVATPEQGDALPEIHDLTEEIGLDPALHSVEALTPIAGGAGVFVGARDECRLGHGQLISLRVGEGDAGEIGVALTTTNLTDRLPPGDNDITALRSLDDGTLLISTLIVVPPTEEWTARGCALPQIGDHHADLFTLDIAGGVEAAQPLSRRLPAGVPPSL